MLALAVVLPAASFAISPTDEEYGQGLVGVAADNSSGSGGISELPFTGLDVAAIAVIGVGLVGAGLAIRRAARTGEDNPA